MKGINTSIEEELIYDDNNAMPVNKNELNALKDSISNLCDLTKLKQSQTETRGKENENLIDLEEGEISDSSNKKNDKMCKFFKHGCCFYGSHCQFLHISDKVYKMFNPSFSHEKSLRENILCLSKIENPCYTQDNKSPWEKGLENAKVLIQKSISKRIDDGELENKKMYTHIFSNSGTIDVHKERYPILKPMQESKFIPFYKIEPLKENPPHRYNRTMKTKTSVNKSSFSNVKKPHYEYKWVDPWMRSKSPKKRKIYKLYSRKDYSHEVYHSSSSSSIDEGSRNKTYKRKLPASHLNLKRSRSYSRSLSRSAPRTASRSRSWSCSSSCSRSSSDSLRSLYRRPIKKSPSNKVFPVAKQTPRKRRSTSLERWFKSQHHAASASRNSTRSSISSVHKSPAGVSHKCNSGSESWSSMTVSSISCSDSFLNSQSNQSKSKVRNGLFNTLRSTTEIKNSSHLQRKTLLLSGNFGKTNSTSMHVDTYACKKNASYKNSPERLSKTCVTGNPSSSYKTKVTASQPKISPKPLPKLSSKSSQNKEDTKNQFSSTVNTLLKYRTLNNCFNEATVSKQNNPIAGAKESCSTFSSQSSKTASTYDGVKSGFQPKRTVTLNLQPKSQKLIKLAEFPHKTQDTTETLYNSEKMAISKRNTLLKQLKLVEDAIAKKRAYQS